MARLNKKTENNGFSRITSSTTVSEMPVARPQTPIKEISSASHSGPTQQQIAERAKAIWLKKGCPTGQDEKNWLEAEAQLKRELSAK